MSAKIQDFKLCAVTFTRETFLRFSFRLPVFAPFGTEGLDVSPEQRKRQQRDEDRREKEREKKGVEKDGF